MLTEKTFDTGEIILNYAEGQPNGAPMVLLHGVARWWHDWERMTPQLEKDWHVYAVDLRGHGKSGRDGDHYLATDYARDVIAFLRDVVGEPAVLVGHSLGAIVALAVAAQASDCARAVVPIDPPLEPSVNIDLVPVTKARFTEIRQMTTGAPTYEALLARLTEAHPDWPANGTEMMARSWSGVAPETMDICLSNRMFEGLDRADMLEQITCPALLLVADWDQGGTMRPQDVDFVRAHLRHLTVYTFPGEGHALPLRKPDEIIEQMRVFLQPT